MTRKLLLVVALAFFAGCVNEDQQRQKSNAEGMPVSQGGRVSVTRIDVLKDDIAYKEWRGVYVIVDNETGREFIGVSGVGIAEVGSRSSGKFLPRDER